MWWNDYSTIRFKPDSNCNNHIHSTNKTNISNNTNHNTLIPISITPSHTNNNIKLAKSISPTPTPIIQRIIPSITSSHHKISASSQKHLQKNISNITPIITNPSITKQPNRHYTSKIEKHVENLKIKILIPSRPRNAYSTDPTKEEYTCKTFTCNSYMQQPIISVTNGTPSNYSFPQESNTVVLHDPKKFTIPILHKIVQQV